MQPTCEGEVAPPKDSLRPIVDVQRVQGQYAVIEFRLRKIINFQIILEGTALIKCHIRVLVNLRSAFERYSRVAGLVCNIYIENFRVD